MKSRPKKPAHHETARPLTCQALNILFAGRTVAELATACGATPPVVHRDLSGERTVSDLRLVAYVRALPLWEQKRQLLEAWLRDALGADLAGMLQFEPGGRSMVAETAEQIKDWHHLPPATREALSLLADACRADRTVQEWIETTAAILAPLAVPEAKKRQARRVKY